MEKMKLTFVNVGYGEAILLECPDPRFADGVFVMVIDGGSGEALEYADTASGRITFAEYLAKQGISHIDLMVSTHIHEDHICGMLPVAQTLTPAVLWQTLPVNFAAQMYPLDSAAAQNPSQEKFIRALNDYQELCALIGARGKTVEALRAGRSGQLCEGLTYQVLAPSAEKAEELEMQFRDLFFEKAPEKFARKLAALDACLNNYSLMLLLDYKGTRLLLPGDTNSQGYGGIDPASLKAHLFKVGHHGQKDGASQELLEAVQPKVAVCCASSDRRYDSAHPDMLHMFEKAGVALYFSDCPKLPGLDLPPHHALTFMAGENGDLSAEYVS